MKRFLTIFVLFMFALIVFGNTEKLLYPIKYKESVIKYTKQFKLEPELVFAVIKAESGFNSNAISRKKAIGLMQLMSDTAESGAKTNKIMNYKDELLFDPDINIQLGCWYLSKLFAEHESMAAVIASYNAGGKNIKNWFYNVDYKNITDEEFYNSIRFPETKNFLKRVTSNYLQYKKIYAGSLSN